MPDTWETLEPLYAHFNGLVKSIRPQAHGDAEDIVQGAFVKLKDKLDNGYTAKNAKGLLERTIANDLKDYLKHKRVHEDTIRELEPLGHAPLGDIEQHMFAVELTDSVRELPELRGRAFTAVELQGATGVEAAEALGTSHEAVRTATKEARQHLRERLR